MPWCPSDGHDQHSKRLKLLVQINVDILSKIMRKILKSWNLHKGRSGPQRSRQVGTLSMAKGRSAWRQSDGNAPHGKCGQQSAMMVQINVDSQQNHAQSRGTPIKGGLGHNAEEMISDRVWLSA